MGRRKCKSLPGEGWGGGSVRLYQERDGEGTIMHMSMDNYAAVSGGYIQQLMLGLGTAVRGMSMTDIEGKMVQTGPKHLPLITIPTPNHAHFLVSHHIITTSSHR